MPTRFSFWIPFMLIGFGHFFVDYYMNLLPMIMPDIAVRLGFSMGYAGLVFTLQSITSSWLQPVVGFWGDRFKSKYFLPFSIFWLGALTTSVGLMNAYWQVLAVCSLGALGSAVYHPLGSVAISSISEKNRSLLMSLYIMMGTLGMSLAPITTIRVVHRAGLEGLPYLAIPGLVVTLLIVHTRNSKKKSKSIKQPDVKKELPAISVSILPILFVLILDMGMRQFVMRSLTTFLPYYYEFLGYPDSYSANILSGFLIAQSIGGIIFGYISDRKGFRATLIISFIAAIVSTAGFFFTTGVSSAVMLLAAGAALQGPLPSSLVFAQDIAPKSKNLASGLMMGLSFGIGSFGSLYTGIVSDMLQQNIILALGSNLIFLVVSAGLVIYLANHALIKRASCTSAA